MTENSINPTLKTWLAAARLRTLPLALAAIILGSLLAFAADSFTWQIFIWSIITAICYQVLSNFANDLGDGIKGTDANRIGEKRAVASGDITITQMKTAVVLFTVLSLISGTWLSIIATNGWVTFVFIALGMAAIWAALNYTIGAHAYGYSGWGDVFVVVFFGLVGVVGSNFLYTNTWQPVLLLPATAVGLLAAGVLNLNNMRDIENDRKAGKITLVVKIGLANARLYHVAILLLALVLHLIYLQVNDYGLVAYIVFVLAPLIMANIISVFRAQSSAAFDPLLKPLALTTLLFCVLAGVGVVFG